MKNMQNNNYDKQKKIKKLLQRKQKLINIKKEAEICLKQINQDICIINGCDFKPWESHFDNDTKTNYYVKECNCCHKKECQTIEPEAYIINNKITNQSYHIQRKYMIDIGNID